MTGNTHSTLDEGENVTDDELRQRKATRQGEHWQPTVRSRPRVR